MMSNKSDITYIVDTNVLVNIRDKHGNSAHLWDLITKEIEAGPLKTVRQVVVELQRRFPDIYARIKRLVKVFVVSDAVLYDAEVVTEIQLIQNDHERLYDLYASGNPADPFLIAVAKKIGGIVVTDEKKDGPKHQRRIPYV